MARGIEALMRAADIAMYRAKSAGGGRHCLFNAELAAEHQEKVETEKALAEAVQRGEFVLAFQPQMSLMTGSVGGRRSAAAMESPARRHAHAGHLHPDRGTDRRDHRNWRMGYRAKSLERSAIGTAPASRAGSPSTSVRARSTAPDFFTKLRTAFEEAGVPLSLIELEFTESAAMEVGTGVLEEIAALRRDGAMITIDDFGTGYSNIARLRAMPLDRVKLDPSLIEEIETCEKARVVVQAVVQLIKGVGCEVVAEAVETVGQADILRAMGCDTIQGYIFAEPMFEQEFLAWTCKAPTKRRNPSLKRRHRSKTPR